VTVWRLEIVSGEKWEGRSACTQEEDLDNGLTVERLTL